MIFKDEKVRAIMALTCSSGGAEGIRTPDPLDAKGILRLWLPLVICKRPAQRLLFTKVGSGLGKII
jgi:hypothetical protein